MDLNEVLRQEKKYLLTAVDALRFSGRLEKAMLADAHNGALGYTIRSLYFDTPYDTDYEEKTQGLALRRKIRLRCYDPNAGFAMLEVKQKSGALQKKRSLRMERDDAARLIDGDRAVLLRYPDPFAAEVYGLMTLAGYRPKTVVEYKRKAFIAKENKIRVTFDSDIRANEANFAIFSENLPLTPVFPGFNTVMEVKYNGFLLSYIKDLLCMADRAQLSVSKYCLARSVGLHDHF